MGDTTTDEEDFQSTLKGLTAMELMDKKDSIEREIKEFMDLLESVSWHFGIAAQL